MLWSYDYAVENSPCLNYSFRYTTQYSIGIKQQVMVNVFIRCCKHFLFLNGKVGSFFICDKCGKACKTMRSL